MIKKKVDVILLGGSGLIGKALIKEFLDSDTKVLNLDLVNNLDRNKNYFYEKFNMTNKNLKKEMDAIFRKYRTPKVFIDCSYISRTFFKKTSIKNLSKNSLDFILKNWLSSSVIISSYLLNKMHRNKIKGSIILTSSIYGIIAQDMNVYNKTNIVDNIAYTLVKSGINNFVKNAAAKYGKFNIRVNSICPGGIYNLNDQNFKNKNFVKNYISKVPLKRFAKPEDLTGAYRFLASEKSCYITGVNLMVDGGYTLT